MEEKIAKELEKWRMKAQTEKRMKEKMTEGWKEVETQQKVETLQNHAKSASMMGIWHNRQVQEMIKILVDKEDIGEEKARAKVEKLAMINLEGATEIEKLWMKNKEGFERNLIEWEKDLQAWTDKKMQMATQNWKITREKDVIAMKQRHIIVTGREMPKWANEKMMKGKEEGMEEIGGKLLSL